MSLWEQIIEPPSLKPHWSDERVERLKALHAEHLTAAKIAAELNVTRNAVIGKCQRLGLHHAPSQHSRTGLNRPKKYKRWHDAGSIKDPPKVIEKIEPRPTRGTLTLLELREDSCRFPFGDKDFKFCGKPRMNGIAYCKACAAVCFSKA